MKWRLVIEVDGPREWIDLGSSYIAVLEAARSSAEALKDWAGENSIITKVELCSVNPHDHRFTP